MSQVPVYLVGGIGLFRRGLSGFLENTDFLPIAEYDSPRDSIEARGDVDDPEIIIYIASGVIEESGQAVDALLGAFPAARVVVLSTALSIEELGGCLRVGAAGYLLSGISKEALVHSLTLIALGETVFPSELAAAWVGGKVPDASKLELHRLRDLTRREGEILGCLTDGASNKRIARQLGITEATVKIHMKTLIRKLGVENRTQAALWAIKAGLDDDGHRAA